MYKNGGVSQSHPATKQPEWSTKSLRYWETDKKKNYSQHPKCPTWLSTWTGNASWSITWTRLEGFRCGGQIRAVCRWISGLSAPTCQDVGFIKMCTCSRGMERVGVGGGVRQEGRRINTSLRTHSSLQGCVGDRWRQMKSELLLSSSGAAEHRRYTPTPRKSLRFGSC